jgi:NADH-quinone oxidoreductase subunit M
MNLSLLIWTPVATALVLIFCKTLRQTRLIAFAGAVLQLLLALYLLLAYQGARAGGDRSQMLFQTCRNWFTPLHIQFHTGVDGISVVMILLTASVVLAGVLVSWSENLRFREFFFLLHLLATGAYGFFISLDLFSLFFFLELAVLPKFLLIGIWGSGKKEYSAMKLALMLMAGSALVLVGILGIYYHTDTGGGNHTFDLLQIAQTRFPLPMQKLFFPFVFAGFGIFGALFPFHTWVPDGHSSAPTAASMFLAGISMKLGGYGCLRVATWLLPEAARAYSGIVIGLATIAILYGAFATMMQKDLKYINAYSSVSHCGFVLLGIGMLTPASETGAVFQMVSHGLMTALFFAAIGMIYTRTHTRMLSRLGGLLKIMPFIATVFVIAGLCSLGLPGLSGFAAEVTVFVGSWQNPFWANRLATILACASIVVTAVYILKAVGQTVMGPLPASNDFLTRDSGWNEKLAAVVLLAGIIIIGMAPFLLTKTVSPDTVQMLRLNEAAVTAK